MFDKVLNVPLYVFYYYLVLIGSLSLHLALDKFSDDAADFLFIKTKYVKVRHFVATNCCFVNPRQKRKQTNLLISTDV